MSPPDSLLPLVIFGVPFHRVSRQETVVRCLELASGTSPAFVATPNLDFVMQAGRDPELYRILARADLVIADGMPVVWLARLLGPPLPERVAGSDLVVDLSAAAAEAGRSIFNLGGAPGVPELAGEALSRRFPALRIAGAYSPPKRDLLEMDHPDILQRIRAAAPDILYVAFGAPKQEKWINMQLQQWKVPLALGIGGSLDFLAGAQRRAPAWMQRSGLEWIWRLGTDPRRLWKRYGANLCFLAMAVLRMALIRCRSGRRPPPISPPPEWIPFRKVWAPLTQDQETSARLRDWMQDRHPRQPLWLDATDCDWLDSRELGLWLRAGQLWREAGLPLVVSGLSPRLRRWMEFNHLDRLWTRIDADAPWPAVQPARADVAARQADGCLRLCPPAELTATSLPAWRHEVISAWEKSPGLQEVQVDAGNLRFLDSAGLGGLIGLAKRAREENLRFEVIDLQGAALTTVRLARVEALLKVEALVN